MIDDADDADNASFFKNMSPLSPILTSLYSDHRNHHWLLSRDPVLCCTILMVSSRYHVLPGAGGESRNFFIHHRLWQHCQQLVMRLTFGQEKASRSKIRSIGTIEALLLMSEWHPRSLHFPPEIDGWDSDLISGAPEPEKNKDDSSASENKWLEDMTEPARRSDQMSWMLLGSALSLAHELGIFEAEDKELDYSAYEGFISSDQMKLRKQRVQRLLYVYINQLAWRIGCMSLMPQSLNHAILGGQKSRELSRSGDEWLTLMDSWMDLTKLAKSVTDLFFPSVEFARQQLHSGRYIGLLDHFRPLLSQWKERYLHPQRESSAVPYCPRETNHPSPRQTLLQHNLHRVPFRPSIHTLRRDASRRGARISRHGRQRRRRSTADEHRQHRLRIHPGSNRRLMSDTAESNSTGRIRLPSLLPRPDLPPNHQLVHLPPESPQPGHSTSQTA